jgi:hypothetical protein
MMHSVCVCVCVCVLRFYGSFNQINSGTSTHGVAPMTLFVLLSYSFDVMFSSIGIKTNDCRRVTYCGINTR